MTFEECLYICWCDYHEITLYEIATSLGWTATGTGSKKCKAVIEKAKKDGLYQEYVNKYETGEFKDSDKLLYLKNDIEKEKAEEQKTILLEFDKDKFKKILTKKGLTDGELCKIFDCYPSRVKILRNLEKPKAKTILEISKKLNIPLIDLIKEVEK